MQHIIFTEVIVILCSSLLVALLFQRLRLPLLLAYIVAGVLIGPSVLGLIQQPGHYTLVAEFGVVFLLFALGLEFSLPKLMALRQSVFGLGSIQVLVCGLLFGLAVYLWGGDLNAAIIIASALALSSTAIVTSELSRLQQVNSRYAQLSIGVLLFQDLIAVLFLILVPTLGGSDGNVLIDIAEALGKGLLLFLFLMSVGKYILPFIYREVATFKSDEILVLTTVVIAIAAAWLTHQFHLSMALGGFIIGMMLGETQYKHQIEVDIRGFKDIFLGLFFVTIGLSIDVSLLFAYWPRILLFALGLVFIKALLITLLVVMLGDKRHTAIRTGMTLAQAGEFGLALIALARLHELLPEDQASFITLVAVASMLSSPFLIRYNELISKRLMAWLGKDGESTTTEVTLHGGDHVVIGGYGRVGQSIGSILRRNQMSYIALETDVRLVERLRQAGENVIYGDCSNIEVLKRCHLGTARLAILTFKSHQQAKATIQTIRDLGIRVPIIVRCREHGDFEELISLGADHVVPEMLETSLVMGAQVLSLLGYSKDEVDAQIGVARQQGYQRLQSQE